MVVYNSCCLFGVCDSCEENLYLLILRIFISDVVGFYVFVYFGLIMLN